MNRMKLIKNGLTGAILVNASNLAMAAPDITDATTEAAALTVVLVAAGALIIGLTLTVFGIRKVAGMFGR